MTASTASVYGATVTKLTDYFAMEVVYPVVDSRIGELTIQVTNPTEVPMQRVSVRVREAATTGAPFFSVTPSADYGGYAIPTIEPGKSVPLAFCVRPVQAEIGREYRFQVVAVFSLEDAKSRDRRARAAGRGEGQGRAGYEEGNVKMLQQEAQFKLPVEARPEVYAAIGALESLRARLLSGYDSLVAKGRDTHDALGTVLPGGSAVEPAHVALDPGSFRFLFEALELGVRVLNVPADRARRTSGGGQGGNSP